MNRQPFHFILAPLLRRGWLLALFLGGFAIYHIMPITLRANEDIASAIQARYPEVAGVELYFQPRGLGDGDRVLVKRDFWETRVVFDHGSGDCPAGCIRHQYWFYVVSPNGSIQLVDTYNGRPPATLLSDFLK